MSNLNSLSNYAAASCGCGHKPQQTQSAFRAVKSTDQAISPPNPFTLVTFGDVQFDCDDEYYPSVSAFISKQDGIYLISSKLIFLSGVDSVSSLAVYISLDGGVTSQQSVFEHALAGLILTAEVSALLELAAGATVQIFALSTVSGILLGDFCDFSAVRVSSCENEGGFTAKSVARPSADFAKLLQKQ